MASRSAAVEWSCACLQIQLHGCYAHKQSGSRTPVNIYGEGLFAAHGLVDVKQTVYVTYCHMNCNKMR